MESVLCAVHFSVGAVADVGDSVVGAVIVTEPGAITARVSAGPAEDSIGAGMVLVVVGVASDAAVGVRGRDSESMAGMGSAAGEAVYWPSNHAAHSLFISIQK